MQAETFQATLFETLTALLSNWVPCNERVGVGVLLYTSAQVGIILSFVGTGGIIQMGGWKLYFYILTGLAAVWCLLFAICCSSEPLRHKCISNCEMEKLHSSVGSITAHM